LVGLAYTLPALRGGARQAGALAGLLAAFVLVVAVRTPMLS